MKRDLQALASQQFDIIVVGGGIAGVSVAREAASRGLSVALVERNDFASGRTGHSPGMLDGGIRSLQRLDFRRVRALSAERNGLLRNAPHLVHPISVAVPTFGRGRDGIAALKAGFALYEMLTTNRNEGITDSSRRLSRSRTIGREDVKEMFPGIPDVGLTGAAIFTDTQLADPARFALALLHSAVEAGAQAANGLEATGIVRKGITVTGVGVRSTEGEGSFVIRGRTVVNTAGAWAEHILEEGLGVTLDPPLTFSRRLSFVVNRRPSHRIGLALLDDSRASRTPFSRSRHHLFVLPWRDRIVVGNLHRDHAGRADDIVVTDDEVETSVAAINERYPGLHLHADEVVGRSASLGLLERYKDGGRLLRVASQARVVDHASVHGTRGIVSLVGATWGTARLDAVRLLDDVFGRDTTASQVSRTLDTPIFGGHIESMEGLVREIHEFARPWGLPRERARALARSYGTSYKAIFSLLTEDPDMAGLLPGTTVLKAEVVHAARAEMALNLDDLIHRRTSLALGPVTEFALEEAAHLMAVELGWGAERKRREVDRAARSIPQVADRVRA